MFWSVTATNKNKKIQFKILHLCIYINSIILIFALEETEKVSAFLLIAVIYISSFSFKLHLL